MTYRALPLLTLTLLLACGPGDDTTDTAATTAPSTSDTAATEQTTAATDPTATASTTGSTATASTTDPTGSTDPTTSATTDATTTTTTTEGATEGATTGEFVCPDTVPAEGTPCTAEGQSCNSGCQDPCSFCNIVTCEDGIWKGMEAFPAECLDCDAVCEAVVTAACAEGPPDQKECVLGCQETANGQCSLVFNQMLACIGGSPTFTCDDNGAPFVVGCEDQFESLDGCLDG